METRWIYTSSHNFPKLREEAGRTCVIPMGCIEKHGLHDPLGTDIIKASHIAYKASQIETVCVFPDFTFGDTPFGPHTKRPEGSICLDVRTQMSLLEQLCDEIARNGFKKILFLNSHGGNWPVLSYFLRCQEYAKKDYATMYTNVRCKTVYNPTTFYELVSTHRDEYPMLTDTDMEVLKGWSEKGSWGGGHADFSEAASVMGKYPNLIATDRLDTDIDLDLHRSDYLTKRGISIVAGWNADHPNAMNGYIPYGVSQTIGQAMNTCCARHLAEMFKMLKADDECIRIATKQPKAE